MVLALGLLRPYVEGTKILIWCDHKALRWILTTTACTNNRLNRWRILLWEFAYDVEYKPGPQHAVADALSCLPTEGLEPGDPHSWGDYAVGGSTRPPAPREQGDRRHTPGRTIPEAGER